MAIIYFPKEGDKRVNACSHSITENGLAFVKADDKLEILVKAGFIRKLAIEEFTLDGAAPTVTNKDFSKWTKYLEGPKKEKIETPVILTPNVAPTLEIIPEDLSIPQVDSTPNLEVSDNVLEEKAETPALVENAPSEAPKAESEVVKPSTGKGRNKDTKAQKEIINK
jgi:hypothetical protein